MTTRDMKMIEIKVKGMTCDKCAENISKALRGTPGVQKVCHVDWKDGLACVDVKKGTSSDTLVQAIQKAGYQAQIGPLEPGTESA